MSREIQSGGRENQSGPQLVKQVGMVYFSGHADGETRRHRFDENRNGENRAESRRSGYQVLMTETARAGPELSDRVAQSRRETGSSGTGWRFERGSFGIVDRIKDQWIFGSTGESSDSPDGPSGPSPRSSDREWSSDHTIAGFGRRCTARSQVPGLTKADESPERVETSVDAPSGPSRVSGRILLETYLWSTH